MTDRAKQPGRVVDDQRSTPAGGSAVGGQTGGSLTCIESELTCSKCGEHYGCVISSGPNYSSATYHCPNEDWRGICQGRWTEDCPGCGAPHGKPAAGPCQMHGTRAALAVAS